MKFVNQRIVCFALIAIAIGMVLSADIARADEPKAQPEHKFFDADGVRLRYIDEGSGEPVVLVHGFSINVEMNWLQTGISEALLQAGFRVIAYDFRGHGMSEKPHDASKYGTVEIADPRRLMDHLGIERAHLVGYSRGAMIAHRARASYPERLLSVVLGGYAETAMGPPFTEEMIQMIAVPMAEGNYRPLLQVVAPAMAPEEVAQWEQMLTATNDPKALAASFRSGAEFKTLSADELRKNKTPTLVLIGEQDFFHMAMAPMAEQMSQVETQSIPEADHVSALGHPEFAKAMVGFLKKQGPPSQ